MELILLAGTDIRRTFLRAQKMKSDAMRTGASVLECDADEESGNIVSMLSAQSLFAERRFILLKNILAHIEISDHVLAWCKDQKKSEDTLCVLEGGALTKTSGNTLFAYMKKHGEVAMTDLPAAIKQATRNDVYHFVDTCLRGDVRGALSEYALLTRTGITVEELFWAIHWQVQALGYVAEASRTLAREDEIAKSTKLHPYVVSKSMRLMKTIPPGFLTKTFSRLRAIDVQIKTTPSKFDDVFLHFLLTT